MRKCNVFVMLLFSALLLCDSAWSLDRFVDMGDGTVLDNTYSIRWLKNANCEAVGNPNWDEAMARAGVLASGMCGLTDGSVAGTWRLPNRNELFYMSYPETSSAQRNAAFTNFRDPAKYWTNATYYYGDCGFIECSDFAWQLDLTTGKELYDSKSSMFGFWPVRNGYIGWMSVSPAIAGRDFGVVSPNTTSASQTFTISNNGTIAAALNILLYGGDTGMFTLNKGDGYGGTCGEATALAAHSSCTVSVAFNPTKPGGKSTTLWINTNAEVNPNTLITLTGNSLEPNVSWWKGENNANDSVGGNIGTMTGGAYASGKVGLAFSFDGTAQYVSVPHSSTFDISGNHSIAMWVKPNALPPAGKVFQLVSKFVNGYEYKRVYIDETGKVGYFLYGTSGSGVLSAASLTPGVWSHVVATYDGANMKIYINGVQDAGAAAAGDVIDSTGMVYLGHNPDPVLAAGEAPFNGLLDEVGWYNRTLSASEVSMLANALPDAFSFTPRTGMPLNAAVVSNPVTITGLNAATTISVTGGEYSVSTDNGATWSGWTSVSGAVAVNNQVRVRLTSAAMPSTITTATLTIGAVSGAFDVTTATSGTTGVSGSGLVSWWRGENNADDTLGGNNGVIVNTLSATVPENQTATISCGGGNTITSFTSTYGADPYWASCGSCTIGASSCSVTYNNTNCVDPYSGHAKQGKLDLNCGDGALFAPGKVGQAFKFGGSTTVSVPHSSSFAISGAHTVAFWVKPAANPAAGKSFYLVNKWVDSAEDKRVSMDSGGKLNYFLYGAGLGVTSASAITSGVWTHVAVSYDGSNMKIYINGVLDATAAASGDVADSSGKLFLGYNPARSSQGNEEPFNGQLDEVLWYSRALSAAEIPALLPNYTLTVSVTGSGGGTITSAPQGVNPVGVSCVAGSCTTTYPFNTPVTLTAAPNAISTFGSWGGDCSGNGACGFIMDTDKAVSANLIQAPLAKNTTCNKTYATLAEALIDTSRAAASGDELLLLGAPYDGAVSLNKGFTLNGGWNATYLSKSGLPATLNGGLTLLSGASSTETLMVKGQLVLQGGSLQVNEVTVSQ